MDHLAIPQQVLNEHQTLAFVTSALRSTIGWKFQGSDLTRKLESTRFVGQSFARHLKRLMKLEEHDGYMAVVLESRPELKSQVVALRKEHVRFRRELRRLLSEFGKIGPTDHDGFAKCAGELLALLDELDEHGKQETSLLQEALLSDEGGEG